MLPLVSNAMTTGHTDRRTPDRYNTLSTEPETFRRVKTRNFTYPTCICSHCWGDLIRISSRSFAS